MEKYKRIIVNSLSQYVAYRLNFILWRVRVVISILISYYLWVSVFQSKTTVFGYVQNQMVTYILLISFLNAVVLSTTTPRVAQEIQDGSLSTMLIRPIHYFGYNFARDFADKCMNTIFSVIEITFLLILIKPYVFIQVHLLQLVLFIASIVLAILMYFCINMILSCIGFWSRESWAPRFIFMILVSFLAGTYFPLDIFPAPMYTILRMLPFSYLVYFPLKIYLGTLSLFEITGGFIMSTVWCFLLYMLMELVWRKGIKLYTSEGI